MNAIKTMMNLEILRGKTPHMMRLELLMGLLAYNLVRLSMLNAASLTQTTPRGLSFTAALSIIVTNWTCMLFMESTVCLDRKGAMLLDKGAALLDRKGDVLLDYVNHLLKELSKHRAGHRPGRTEPRVLKRRNNAYPPMKQPRKILREKLHAPDAKINEIT